METVSIGRIVAAFGVAGEIIIEHRLGRKGAYAGLSVLLVSESGGSQIPYFVEKAHGRTETELVVKLEGINTREKALRLLKKEVFLKQEDFEKYAKAGAPVTLLGYQLFNEKKRVGVIDDIIEQPHQLIAVLQIEGKEVMVPLHQDNLLKIDVKNRQVVAVLPDGLVEMYLEG